MLAFYITLIYNIAMRIESGILKGRKLKTIVAQGYRPAMARVRGAIFSMLDARGYYCEDRTILDIFAGSGSLAFEALSRGARHATFVEFNRHACATIEHNATSFSLLPQQYSIYTGKAEDFIRKAKQTYDIIFIDPPYYQGYLKKTLHLLLRFQILHEESIIVTETEPDLSFNPETLCDALESIVDVRYGQTRVNFWIPRSSHAKTA